MPVFSAIVLCSGTHSGAIWYAYQISIFSQVHVASKVWFGLESSVPFNQLVLKKSLKSSEHYEIEKAVYTKIHQLAME